MTALLVGCVIKGFVGLLILAGVAAPIVANWIWYKRGWRAGLKAIALYMLSYGVAIFAWWWWLVVLTWVVVPGLSR